MCIGIEKISETDADARYAFVADVYEPAPNRRSQMVKTGQNRGVLQVVKLTGEVVPIEAMPEDADNKRFEKAARRIRQHWSAGELPDKTLFACG